MSYIPEAMLSKTPERRALAKTSAKFTLSRSEGRGMLPEKEVSIEIVMLVQPDGVIWRFSSGEESASPAKRIEAKCMMPIIMEVFLLWFCVFCCVSLMKEYCGFLSLGSKLGR
jgi:hypothetical protein